MVDNRSAGFYGIGGAFNFKSGDISGTAARTQDDKMGQGGEYFAQKKKEAEEENQEDNKYMDRSAVLRATLNSLAMMNVANVINARKRSILDDKNQQNHQQNNDKKNKHEDEALNKEFDIETEESEYS